MPKPHVESTKIEYSPGLQDSGDLEGATTAITATELPGTPDYSTELTVPMPGDGRIAVKDLALRLDVTIDSFNGGCTTLTYRVFVNDEGSETLGGEWAGIGDQKKQGDKQSGIPADGVLDCDVYFWVDAGNAVVSKVQVRTGVGTRQNTDQVILEVNGRDCIMMSAVQAMGIDNPTQHPADYYNGKKKRGADGAGEQNLAWSELFIADTYVVKDRVDDPDATLAYINKFWLQMLEF